MSVNVVERKQSRKEQKAATREAIREAARRCFERSGYEGTSIADIAREAGVANGTLYVHFESKDAVLDELLVEFNESLASKLSPVLMGAIDGGLPDVVRGVAEVFLDHWAEGRGFVECYARRLAMHLDVSSLRDGVNPPMTYLLQAAMESELARRGEGEAVAELATQALLGLWLRVGLQYLFNDGVSREQALTVLVRMSVGSVEGLIGGEIQ